MMIRGRSIIPHCPSKKINSQSRGNSQWPLFVIIIIHRHLLTKTGQENFSQNVYSIFNSHISLSFWQSVEETIFQTPPRWQSLTSEQFKGHTRIH